MKNMTHNMRGNTRGIVRFFLDIDCEGGVYKPKDINHDILHL